LFYSTAPYGVKIFIKKRRGTQAYCSQVSPDTHAQINQAHANQREASYYLVRFLNWRFREQD